MSIEDVDANGAGARCTGGIPGRTALGPGCSLVAAVEPSDCPRPGNLDPCSPIAQTGCGAGEKCTWITFGEKPIEGAIDCVPLTGDEAADGQPCSRGPLGPQGYDNCGAGEICEAGRCAPVCDPQEPACGDQQVCRSDPVLFNIGGTIVAGACVGG